MFAPYSPPAEAMDIMVLNDLDRPRHDGITLTGLRSATAQVLDTAARALDTTRAAAHAELWPLALHLVRERQMPTTDHHRRRAAFVSRLRSQTREDSYSVRRLISQMAQLSGRLPVEYHDRVRRDLARLLAGAAVWLPLIGESGGQPHDTLAREGLSVGLLILDALAARGVTDTYINDDGGRAPEHIILYVENGDIRIGTEEENVSQLPEATCGLLAEYADENTYTYLYDGTRTRVTPAVITEVADVVAERVRGARTS